MRTPSISDDAWLVPLAGPPLDPIALRAADAPLTLGRHGSCHLRLPSDADSVSRLHARLERERGQWHILDLQSRWGTLVNGVPLKPHRAVPLAEGDLLRVAPWTFSFTASGPDQRGQDSHNDLEQMQTLVREVHRDHAPALAEEMLTLLLESAAQIHAAHTETELAGIVLEVAQRGTGLPNAAYLRPLDASGRIQVVAQRPEEFSGFSRTLLTTASRGVAAQLGDLGPLDTTSSVVQLRISSAICAPVVISAPDQQHPGTVAAYLYLDARARGGPQRGHPAATAFVMALARMAGLALAGLKRLDMERRAARIDAELAAAAHAQQLILPPRAGNIGGFSYAGQSRPGEQLAGDFFDVVALADGRVAVSIGDVCGKGVSASVLMTTTQGFLHSAMMQHGDPALAATQLNAFLGPRLEPGKFLTLWLAVLDPRQRTCAYVDAGHGYAAMLGEGAEPRMLGGGDNLPIGVSAGIVYTTQTVPLPPKGRIVLVSDGVIEQPAGAAPANERRQFGLEGLRRALADAPNGREIEGLFSALIAHAASESLADDATALAVRW